MKEHFILPPLWTLSETKKQTGNKVKREATTRGHNDATTTKNKKRTFSFAYRDYSGHTVTKMNNSAAESPEEAGW